MDSNALKSWFLANRRDLPWRHSPSPYSVWISEVMLQQTQASVVIGYFKKWMDRFPSLESIAKAPLEELIKNWEGLGYYNRVRLLHRAARLLLEQNRGLPSTFEELLKIPGLGSYTAAAIANFAFHRRVAAVDGNVLRVVGRYLALEEDISKVKTKKKVFDWVNNFLPEKEPWILMEALIELGALVCQKKPQCPKCPLKENCLAFQSGRANDLPIKNKKTVYVALEREVAVIKCGNLVLMRQEREKKLMAGLFEFPYCDEKIEDFLVSLGLKPIFQDFLPSVQQSFTRFRVTLQPSLWICKETPDIPSFFWGKDSCLKDFPFSSGHKKILNSAQQKGFL
jgi:A/G-specific adenine glycosylase